MIPVRIAGLAVDVRSQPVVILKPIDDTAGEKVLPIWIGHLEATAILAGLEGKPMPRPLTLDLMRDMLATLDAEVDRVTVTRIEQGTFYAEILLNTPDGERVLDARPSDALGLSLRTDATLWVAAEVLDRAGIIVERDEDDAAEQEETVAEFSKFLEHVDPEDFQG